MPPRLARAAILLLALTACASTEIKNLPLAASEKNPTVPVIAWQPNRPFIMVAFSGGGSRAAAMAYYTMEALNSVNDGIGNETLLDDVGVISSVSGGSITAAYFGLYGKTGLPNFYADFLIKTNMWTLESQLLNPLVDAKLAFGAMDRADAAQNLFDAQLFHHATFAALQARQPPIILLNATDMASGNVFDFGPERFNDICSNLSQLPISAAVTSSSAFPILLSPVTLQDYSAQQCDGNRPAADPKPAAAAPYAYFDSYQNWLYMNDLRHGLAARVDIQYIHLLDGGLADNLGVSTLEKISTSPDIDAPVLNLINSPTGPKKIVVIVVRARSFVESPLYQKPSTPGEVAMIGAVTGIPLDANTNALNDNESDLLELLQTDIQEVAQAYQTPAAKIYDINVDPAQLEGAEAQLGNTVEAIPTAYTVTKCDLQNIQQSVQDLLADNPNFQALVTSLGAHFQAPQPTGKICL